MIRLYRSMSAWLKSRSGNIVRKRDRPDWISQIDVLSSGSRNPAARPRAVSVVVTSTASATVHLRT